jgi:predicted Zn-dependent protease
MPRWTKQWPSSRAVRDAEAYASHRHVVTEVLKRIQTTRKHRCGLETYSMMSGQWDKAVDRFHHLTQIRPEVEMYWLNKSQSLLQMGDTTAALTSAQEYLNTYPEATRINDLVAGLQN